MLKIVDIATTTIREILAQLLTLVFSDRQQAQCDRPLQIPAFRTLHELSSLVHAQSERTM
jgi:hypothetical protein